MLFFLGGLALAAMGTYMVYRYALTRTYVRAPGVIVDLAAPKGRMRFWNGRRDPKAAVFQFVDGQGRLIRRTSDTASYPWPTVGRQVTVLYDPADPEGTADTRGSANWTLVGGLFFLIGGLGVIAMEMFRDTLTSL